MDGRGKQSGRRPLPLYGRIFFGTGHIINVLAISMWFPYNVTFFQKVLRLPPKDTGTIILIAQVAGAISTPFIGVWSDQTRCRYPGRRKIFHLLGVGAVASSFFFVWHDCFGCTDVSPSYKVLYYASFAAVFQFGWAAVQIAQLSLIPELTNDKHIKVELNSTRYTFTILSNLLVFSCFWVLLEKINRDGDATNLTPNDKNLFWIMALIVICLGVPVSLLFQVFIHEDPNARPPKLKWYKWLMNPRFYLVACGFMAARIVVILPQTYLPLYLVDTLNMDRASIAKGPLILFISSFFVTFIVKKFNKVVGDKMTFFLGFAVVWGALIWFWVKDPSSDSASHFNWYRDSIYGATILLGAGGATVLVISMAKIAYLVGEYTGSSAFVYGWMSFADRLSNGVIVKIIQQVQPPSASGKLPDFYRNVLVFLPFSATAVGIFTIAVMILLECCHRNRTTTQLPPTIQSDEVEHMAVSGWCSCLLCCNKRESDPEKDDSDAESIRTLTKPLLTSSQESI